jgi:hypothetical protein
MKCGRCTMRIRSGGWTHHYDCPFRKSELAAELRARRAASGLCACCGRMPGDGFKTCAIQRARVRSAKKRAA